jgi:hypothetical protein
VRFSTWQVPAPSYFASQIFPLLGYLRITLRGFFLAHLSLCLFAAWGLAWLSASLSARHRCARLFLPPAMAGLVLIENLSVPLLSFPATPFMEPEPAYVELMERLAHPVVVDLPASGVTGDGAHGEPLFPQNREHIYMLWQTRHRASIVNGLNAYPPRTRVELQPALDDMPSAAACDQLWQAGVRFVAYHARLLLPTEARLPSALRASPRLRLVYADLDFSLFELLPIDPKAP